MKEPLTICLSKNPQVPRNKPFILVGDCADMEEKELLDKATGYPPQRDMILDKLLKAMAK